MKTIILIITLFAATSLLAQDKIIATIDGDLYAYDNLTIATPGLVSGGDFVFVPAPEIKNFQLLSDSLYNAVVFIQVRENKSGFTDSLQVLQNISLENLDSNSDSCTVVLNWGSYKNSLAYKEGKASSENYIEKVTFPKSYLINLITSFYQMSGQ